MTLAERKSRYSIARILLDRKGEHVTPAIIKALKAFPNEMVKTITFDRGKEFARYEEIEKQLNCQAYFAIPIMHGKKERMKTRMVYLENFILKEWIYLKSMKMNCRII